MIIEQNQNGSLNCLGQMWTWVSGIGTGGGTGADDGQFHMNCVLTIDRVAEIETARA